LKTTFQAKLAANGGMQKSRLSFISVFIRKNQHLSGHELKFCASVLKSGFVKFYRKALILSEK